MGLKAGLQFLQKSQVLREADNLIGIGVRRFTKPTNLVGLHLAPSLTCDTIQLTKNHYLSDSFIKSLTQIKGKDNFETANLVKNRILMAMGYKNPELLKLECDSLECSILAEKCGAGGGFSSSLGTLGFPKETLDVPVEQLIPVMYHELDHMDKYVKLYKGVGDVQFHKLLVKQQKNLPFYHIYKKKGYDVDLMISDINHDFYKKMVEYVDIEDFDVKKWRKAVQDYTMSSPRYRDQYKYYNNPLEVSAYGIQSKVNKILGLPAETARDKFPKNYTSIIDSLKKQGITDIDKQEKIVQDAVAASELKYMDKRLIELLDKKFTGAELTSDEIKFFDQLLKDGAEKLVEKTKDDLSFLQQIFLDAESYINKGIFSVEDIIHSLTV